MRPTAIERFESKLVRGPADECWLWVGTVGTPRRGTGYGQFWDGVRITGAHRYSYLAYVGAIPEGKHVLHRCDNTLCVNPAHLFLGTHADNMADKVSKNRQSRLNGDRNGSRLHPERRPRGEASSMAKLTEAQVNEIRSIQGQKQAQIAARYGVNQSQVSAIQRGKTWAHLPMPDGATAPGRSKLVSEQVLAIRAASGETHRQLAKRFGVSKSLVGAIRSGKYWAHIQRHQPPEESK